MSTYVQYSPQRWFSEAMQVHGCDDNHYVDVDVAGSAGQPEPGIHAPRVSHASVSPFQENAGELSLMGTVVVSYLPYQEERLPHNPANLPQSCLLKYWHNRPCFFHKTLLFIGPFFFFFFLEKGLLRPPSMICIVQYIQLLTDKTLG